MCWHHGNFSTPPIVQFQRYQPPLREEYQRPAHPPGFMPQQFETLRKSTSTSFIWQATLQNEYVLTETETDIQSTFVISLLFWGGDL
uniref:Uncharacterized protein n=1 Tax=Acrobeloides nanus TaxID=290746 RepID=A0A914DR28_9BILA